MALRVLRRIYKEYLVIFHGVDEEIIKCGGEEQLIPDQQLEGKPPPAMISPDNTTEENTNDQYLWIQM